jgi:hypothetical protein
MVLLIPTIGEVEISGYMAYYILSMEESPTIV